MPPPTAASPRPRRWLQALLIVLVSAFALTEGGLWREMAAERETPYQRVCRVVGAMQLKMVEVSAEPATREGGFRLVVEDEWGTRARLEVPSGGAALAFARDEPIETWILQSLKQARKSGGAR